MGTIRQLKPVAFLPHTNETITASTVILSRSKCGRAVAEHVTQAHRVTAKSRQSCSKITSNSHLRTSWSLILVVLINLLSTSLANPVFVDNPSLAQFQSGRNIRHLPCIVRKSGRSGVCMFAIDCIKQNGTHLGTCIDRFYFGSCCQLKEDTLPEISDNSIDQNTISHFSHEPTTLPTSSLFKLTTEAQTHPQHSSTSGISTGSSSVTAPLRNITQSYAPSSTSGKPIKHTPTKRPPAHTTHKYSQFVVRTTAKPSLGIKPTAAPTTIKPPRRKTTVAAPVLTTLPPMLPTFEQRIETTTLPTKIFTFQIVETTMPTPTEATKLDEVPTTFRPFYTTRRTKPPANSSVTRVKATTALPTTTSVATTTARPTPPVRNTYRPNPQHHKKPTAPPTASQTPSATAPPTTPKATQTKRPIGKPTRRPVANATIEKIKPPVTHTSSSTTVRKPPATTTTNNEEVTTTFSQTQPTHKPAITNNTTPISTQTQTTRAPRPKPKPTAHIVKVPKPATEAQPETVPPIHTSTTIQATKKPIPQAQTTSSVATKPQPTTTHTTTTTTTVAPITTATHTTTTTPTPMPSTATRGPSITSTTEKPTTTSTTPAPVSSTTITTTLTTEAPKVELPVTATETTLKPGLVTWTDVEAEPVTNASTIEGWQPLPPASDWVPVSTIAPEHVNKTNPAVSSTAYTTETTPTASSTEKIIVSVSSSVSEVMHNVSSSSMPRPERPVLTTISTTATKAPRPKPTSTTTSSASITSSTSSPSTTSIPSTSTTTKPTPSSEVTEMAMDFNVTTGFDTTTEGGIFGTGTGTGSSTIEYTTEDFNATVDMTTISPVNALEGMDYRQICGRRMFPEPRIVGGSNAAFGRWPWQISLRQWRTSTYLHKCGAALLNENWAITAAHCVDNVPPSDLLLRLGEYDLAEEEEPYGYQERRVQIVASHPQFDPRTFEYDLALLRFYEPVVFQPNIIPVCVPNSDLDFIGQTAFVTGWGRLYEDGPLPSVLQEVAVPIINNTICEGMYRSAGYIEHIPHIFICAGWKKGGYDSCEGDSGGPMVLQREDDKRFQLGGVISWGIGCAEANQPGVYTRISEFRDWINQILQF